jgi:hypothetical protein
MQKDTRYVYLKEELAYSETALQEVEAKLQNFNQDIARIIDQLNQVLYIKSQIKQKRKSPIEYLVPKDIHETLSKVSR